MSSIVSSELKVYRSANASDLSSNGGRLSANILSSGVLGALFPNVDDAERVAGSVKYRKVFFKVDHNGPESLLSARLYQDLNTTGNDFMTFFPGSQTDTQATITGSERKYGCAALTATVVSGVTSVQATLQTGAPAIFQNGDVVRITDKATPTSSGNEEFVTLTAGASMSGSVATLTFTPALVNGYAAGLTKVESVYSPGNVVASYGSTGGTLGGTIDWTQLVLNDQSTVEQTVTLTWTSATAFNVTSDVLGSLGSGSTTAGASPNNPSFSLPYFNLPSGAFSGTFVTGNTATFATHPAAVPIWLRRDVPAGAATNASETTTIAWDGGAT